METTQMSITWQMDKWNMVYSYSRVLFVYKKEVPIHAMAWMNLRSTMLNGVTQTRKATHCMILFKWNSQIRQIIETKQTGWGGTGSDCFLSVGFPSGLMKMFGNLIVLMATQHCECTKRQWLDTWKRLEWSVLRHVYFTTTWWKSTITTKECEWENMFPFTQISAHSFPIGKYCQEFLAYPRKTVECLCEHPI